MAVTPPVKTILELYRPSPPLTSNTNWSFAEPLMVKLAPLKRRPFDTPITFSPVVPSTVVPLYRPLKLCVGVMPLALVTALVASVPACERLVLLLRPPVMGLPALMMLGLGLLEEPELLESL